MPRVDDFIEKLRNSRHVCLNVSVSRNGILRDPSNFLHDSFTPHALQSPGIDLFRLKWKKRTWAIVGASLSFRNIVSCSLIVCPSMTDDGSAGYKYHTFLPNLAEFIGSTFFFLRRLLRFRKVLCSRSTKNAYHTKIWSGCPTVLAAVNIWLSHFILSSRSLHLKYKIQIYN